VVDSQDEIDEVYIISKDEADLSEREDNCCQKMNYVDYLYVSLISSC
jgi:hypothetical protein